MKIPDPQDAAFREKMRGALNEAMLVGILVALKVVYLHDAETIAEELVDA